VLFSFKIAFSFPPLESKLFGGKCLTYIGTEGDFRLVSQIQAAAVSSMSNIAEGFSRKGHKEFIQFLLISKSSAAEVQSQLYVALDQEYVLQSDFNAVYEQADVVSKMSSNFISYLKSQLKRKGPAPNKVSS